MKSPQPTSPRAVKRGFLGFTLGREDGREEEERAREEELFCTGLPEKEG